MLATQLIEAEGVVNEEEYSIVTLIVDASLFSVLINWAIYDLLGCFVGPWKCIKIGRNRRRRREKAKRKVL